MAKSKRKRVPKTVLKLPDLEQSKFLRPIMTVIIMPGGVSQTPQKSLALIGNASGQTFWAEGVSNRGVFDKETRRKPLAFAADAGRYGI